MKKFTTILFLLSVSYSTIPMMDLFFGSKPKPTAPNNPVQTQPQKKEPTQIQKTEVIQVPKTDGPSVIHLHLTIVNDIDSGNVTVNNQSYSNASSASSAQAQAEAQVDVEVTQSLQNMYQEQVQTFWHDNKLYLGAGALVTLYSYYCYQVISGNFYLKRTDLWSSWKQELSFDQLCLIPQQILARELVLSIQQHGLDVQKPTDFMIPLVSFLQVIEEERIKLLYYQTLYNRITMLKCGSLFPFNKKRYNDIEKRLQRLSFVKNIFISWMAEFNIEHNRSLARSKQ